MNIAEKICFLRNQMEMSQTELAELLQVSRQTVSKWETGVTFPEIVKLIAISDLFHVSIDYLVRDNETTKQHTSLDRLVLKFLGSAQDMEKISGELVDIMRDGVIDADERARMLMIVDKLNAVSHMIEVIKCALNSETGEETNEQKEEK